MHVRATGIKRVSLLNRSQVTSLSELTLYVQLLFSDARGSSDDIDFPVATRRESRSSIACSPTRKKYPSQEALRFHPL